MVRFEPEIEWSIKDGRGRQLWAQFWFWTYMLRSTCMLIIHSGTVVKVNSNTTPAQSVFNATRIVRRIQANRDMPLSRGRSCFNSWTAMQKTMQMDDKLLTGWSILPLPQKKVLCNCVYLTQFNNLLWIHLSVTVTMSMK
jgi:hypothetical protein